MGNSIISRMMIAWNRQTFWSTDISPFPTQLFSLALFSYFEYFFIFFDSFDLSFEVDSLWPVVDRPKTKATRSSSSRLNYCTKCRVGSSSHFAISNSTTYTKISWSTSIPRLHGTLVSRLSNSHCTAFLLLRRATTFNNTVKIIIEGTQNTSHWRVTISELLLFRTLFLGVYWLVLFVHLWRLMYMLM